MRRCRERAEPRASRGAAWRALLSSVSDPCPARASSAFREGDPAPWSPEELATGRMDGRAQAEAGLLQVLHLCSRQWCPRARAFSQGTVAMSGPPGWSGWWAPGGWAGAPAGLSAQRTAPGPSGGPTREQPTAEAWLGPTPTSGLPLNLTPTKDTPQAAPARPL